MNSILSRISKLEHRYKPTPLVVLAEVNGVQVEVPAKWCIEHNEPFIRVIHGNSMDDLDGLLSVMRKECI